MQEVYDFLKKCGVYYLATVDEAGHAKCRPFGTISIFEGKLYIQTGKRKEVSKQMKKNPYIEIVAFSDGVWIRLNGKAVLDERVEAQIAMLDKYPELKGMYQPNDGNNEVFYLEDPHAVIHSFKDGDKVLL